MALKRKYYKTTPMVTQIWSSWNWCFFMAMFEFFICQLLTRQQSIYLLVFLSWWVLESLLWKNKRHFTKTQSRVLYWRDAHVWMERKITKKTKKCGAACKFLAYLQWQIWSAHLFQLGEEWWNCTQGQNLHTYRSKWCCLQEALESHDAFALIDTRGNYSSWLCQ